MTRYWCSCLSLFLVAQLAAEPVCAQPPVRDLTVELREVVESDPGAYIAGTQQVEGSLTAQLVIVRNGEKAFLKMNRAMPVQWVQSVQAQSATLTAAGSSAGNSAIGANTALNWLEEGQSIAIQPRWPGGNKPVSVEVDVQTYAVDGSNSNPVPAQLRSQMATTVLAPLGYWVVIGKTGKSPTAGTFSSEPAKDVARQLQLRVSAD